VSTPGENSAYPDGVVDVGIIVSTCFENPLKEHSAAFLADVLIQRKKAAIPVTAIIGAYHIATRYLRVPRMTVKKTLGGILRTGSPALYGHVSPQMAQDALDYASTYLIESWDGYLISLARSLRSTVVFSLDEELRKVREITLVNPFPREDVERYHDFLEEGLR
jgi:predicted nucleic acid-binding protein